MFRKAERRKVALKLALTGPAGSGKTYSSLLLAKGISDKIAMLDTENGSGEIYSHLCVYDVCPIKPPFEPQKFINAIHEAENLGYEVLIIDSLSQEWSGQGGILEMVDRLAAASKTKNSFTAWKDATPEHQKLIDTILQSKMHIIACMRSKTAYALQQNEYGKQTPIKLGLAPIQRDNIDYEFSVVFDLSCDQNIATVSKDRTGMFEGFCQKITPEVGMRIKEWSESGAEMPPEPIGNSYVLIIGEKCWLNTRTTGKTDIKEMSTENLQVALTVDKYEMAWPHIQKELDERQQSVECKAVPEVNDEVDSAE